MPGIKKENKDLKKFHAQSIIDSLLDLFDENYVFPDAAERLRKALKQRVKSGEYSSIEDPDIFAKLLTKQVYEILKDKHVRVYYAPEKDAGQRRKGDNDRAKFLKSANYAFHHVERLSGNIGYLELGGFVELSESAKETACAAMTFLNNTDALIIDLRKNGGGNPEMVAYLSSYLFTEEPVHLNSLYWRPKNLTEEFWTYQDVLGPRYGINKPVYVLISKYSFSGAEEFAYNLKSLKRALLVGEVSGGGAHPGEEVSIGGDYYVWVSTGRAINPYTNTNWEGIGVMPDIESSSTEALDKAHLVAIDSLLALTPSKEMFGELSAARLAIVKQSSGQSNK